MVTADDLRGVEDSVELFRMATEGLDEHQSEVIKLATIRSRAGAALHAAGYSYRDLAQLFDMSVTRIAQIIRYRDPGSTALRFLKSWRQIEVIFLAVAQTAGLDEKDSYSYRKTSRILLESSSFPSEAKKSLKSLMEIRNNIMHASFEISDDAIEEVIAEISFVEASIVIWLRRNRAT